MKPWQICFLIASVCFSLVGFIELRKDTIVRSEAARYFMAGLIAMLFVSLTACATPAVHDRIVEVVKPVATQPITAAQVPQVPAPLGPRPQSLSAATDLLLSKWCEGVGYFLRADPLLRLSAGEAQKALGAYPECNVN